MGRAAKKLLNQPERETVTLMLPALPTRTAMLTARCVQLPRFLAANEEPVTIVTWSFCRDPQLIGAGAAAELLELPEAYW